MNVRSVTTTLFLIALSLPAQSTERSLEVEQKLEGFDTAMHQVLRDWNGVGIGVGVIVDDQLVFAKGYGYRDYDNKLPVTSKTVFQIASNTKLFTAVAAGFLVEEGKLSWDGPIRESVPTIQFYNDTLNNTVTLRDMLAHRTGITRHDSVWYKARYSNEELFARLKFLEPSAPPRQVFLYNNLMYAGVGYITALKSGKPWQEVVREKILVPLKMDSTGFSIADLKKQEDHGVPYEERRDSAELFAIPYYEDTQGLAAAGTIVSNIEDLSHWLIALMNEGRYQGKQVLPPRVLTATLQPAIPLPNLAADERDWWELQNTQGGMGRRIGSYRGHVLAYHGGALPGFFSQVSYMPLDRIGVIVFTIGRHTYRLTDAISYNVYERLLGLSPTPWTDRWLQVRLNEKAAGTAARAQVNAARIPGTRPSHALQDFVGQYEHPAYGVLNIALQNGKLQFRFNKFHMPLTHYHYDRFMTPNDEQDGLWSVNFSTHPMGNVDGATLSLDETEATFKRKPPTLDRALLERLAGTYENPTGVKFQIAVSATGDLLLSFPGAGDKKLIPYRGLQFRIPEFSDVQYEFVLDGDRVTGLKHTDRAGVNLSPRL